MVDTICIILLLSATDHGKCHWRSSRSKVSENDPSNGNREYVAIIVDEYAYTHGQQESSEHIAGQQKPLSNISLASMRVSGPGFGKSSLVGFGPAISFELDVKQRGEDEAKSSEKVGDQR